MDKISKLKTKKEKEEVASEYVPVDFDAYSIADASCESVDRNELKKEKIQENEKIWRISSLSASVDDETKILVLPVQAAKRKVKIEDTSYEF